MRKLAAVLAACALAACGSSPSGLDGGGGGSGVLSSITVEGGDGQKAPPETPVPDSIVGRALDDSGNPIEGRLVNFEIPAGPEAGTFDASALETNAQGRVFNELRAGTVAWTRRVLVGEDSAYTARLVASRDGRPDEIAEFTFAVLPGDATGDRLSGFGSSGESPLTVRAGTSDGRGTVLDAWDNPVPFSVVPTEPVASQQDPTDYRGRRTLVADSVGCARVDVTVADTLVRFGAVNVRDQDSDGTPETIELRFANDGESVESVLEGHCP